MLKNAIMSNLGYKINTEKINNSQYFISLLPQTGDDNFLKQHTLFEYPLNFLNK